MQTNSMQTIGWREWVNLPGLGAVVTKAKIDTGARTSALHAYYVEPFRRDGKNWVRFGLHPLQGDKDTAVDCEAPVVDRRQVTDSGGHREMRYVIATPVQLGAARFDVEVTLTDRENMRFRMLLGRTALKARFLVDSNRSFLLGGDKTHPPKQA
ncbi:ATP-dependent zinc protease [Marinimicrobium sp. ABcell2]|uniref:ATP-dependent zinc protease family protein n=1 Tax=Marinimicrobium sp. ABcell2 TaxID=3069751 RepID=UPI0027B3AF3B|nr:ATP-dependent zinc protease [Marinimicrobium sp. ABcell2]MDQ2077600.1 ATP-dependent zinc protease [Marinimicrobium sp. ABcell2]